MLYCTNCGTKLNENQKFCTICGTLIHNSKETLNNNCAELKAELKTENNNVLKEPINTVKVDNPSNIHFKKWQITALISTIVLISLIGIFFKQIKSSYYFFMYKIEKNAEKKFDYACESLENWQTNFTINAFKTTASDLIKQNNTEIENEILKFQYLIKPEDLKEINKNLYNQKALNSAQNNNFDEAFSSLIKFKENGGNVKDNEKYEVIMLNIISKLTNTKVYNTKEALYNEETIYFDNLDEDSFDEIIEVKEQNSGFFYNKYAINLYKVINDKYEKVYTETTDVAETLNDCGIYTYDKNKKGFFFCLGYGKYNHIGQVFKVKNNSLVNLGTVDAFYPTIIEDIDKDEIYEISSTIIDDPDGMYSYADAPKITTWYKFKDDGANNPVAVKEEKYSPDAPTDSSAINNASENKDFILPDSDKKYLTDAEISILSLDDLKIARNEIFARHGFVFKTDKYVQYFGSKTWYTPDPNYNGSESSLNEYEKANLKLIQKWENSKQTSQSN
ncbi:YARHG domain-containing protein [Clostridium sp. SYSU_GA19001]|uniref:YARHG domain-containing protein n=1 Tax=Clostridium caldaquaticum TaxID=2940653 RepID=UPI0020773FA8|nr:YARHG domain-containing protein [Clostridium caldaquaticum]MCM8710082.1 YARHG domain-containing protein [Clostridium caldaquaticum]